MTIRYVLDTGALIALERGKPRAARFAQLARTGHAQLDVPLPVIAEWWRGRTDTRESILAYCRITAAVTMAQAAGVALARIKDVEARLTIDAMVIAAASLLDAIVITGDPVDFDVLRPYFPGVAILRA